MEREGERHKYSILYQIRQLYSHSWSDVEERSKARTAQSFEGLVCELCPRKYRIQIV